MFILLVNDDGIQAPGIRALCDAATLAGHRIAVCAPDRERSAASHSITLRRPLKADPVPFPGAEIAYAVDGTPSDCANLGLFLIPGVEAVISGINNGSNMGGACVYSGTVAAAMEASMSGCPALAVSSCGYNTHDYDAAARVSMDVLNWMSAHPLPRGDLYNLNVPVLPYEELKGIRAATLAPSYMDTPFYHTVETENGLAYTYGHGHDSVDPDVPGSDVYLTNRGYATLTRLSWDMRKGEINHAL